MSIKFFIPSGLTIPTDLTLDVDGTKVNYERIKNGFRFIIFTESGDEAFNVVNQIIDTMISEHDESEHGVSWRTTSFKFFPTNCDFKHVFEWTYRIRDSY